MPHLTKAATLAPVWQYPPNFNATLNQAWLLTGNERLRGLRAIDNVLPIGYYMHSIKEHLDTDEIGGEIESIAKLLKTPHPPTGLLPGE